ncbi:MAG: PadR family transcriptional regulator [Candidatus Bathyarchaeota archaeon]
MFRDFFLGFIKIHILHHASKEPIFGTGIMEEIRSHGYKVSPGLIYPTLSNLERRGLILSEKRVINGKARKYYTITDQGRGVLAEAKEKIRELVEEVM